MRAIFMGTPDFAVPTLQKMIENENIDVVLVVTKEDKPKGRGKKMAFTEVKEVALEHNIEVFTPKRVKSPESYEYIKSFAPDVIIVVAYGQILSKEILDIPKYGCINIHGSILPAYRGPAPIHRAVINGDKKTGVTIMYMNEGLDTGDIIKTVETDILEEDNTGTVYDRLKNIGADALISTLNDIENGIIVREKQDDEKATYAPLIEKEKCVIDFNKNANEIKNFVRGLLPFPKAYTYLEDVLYKITDVTILDEMNKNEVCGTITDVTKDKIVVAVLDKKIIINKIQKEGSKELLVSEFLKGHTISKGQSFKMYKYN